MLTIILIIVVLACLPTAFEVAMLLLILAVRIIVALFKIPSRCWNLICRGAHEAHVVINYSTPLECASFLIMFSGLGLIVYGLVMFISTRTIIVHF